MILAQNFRMMITMLSFKLQCLIKYESVALYIFDDFYRLSVFAKIKASTSLKLKNARHCSKFQVLIGYYYIVYLSSRCNLVLKE